MSMKYFITGLSGTGKSSIAAALNAMGIKSVDIDSLSSWRDKTTDKPVDICAPRDKQFFDCYIWKCDEDKLRDLLDQQTQPIVIVGITSDQNRYFHLFDRIILLKCCPETILYRLATRKENSFGKTIEEQNHILSLHEEFEASVLNANAIAIVNDGDISHSLAAINDIIRSPSASAKSRSHTKKVDLEPRIS